MSEQSSGGLKIIVTTSNAYAHLLPIFAYLFNRYMPDEQVTVLGYDEPIGLPDNFTFVSLGTQGAVSEWSTDIRKWVEQDDADWYLWLMEDQFLKAPVDTDKLADCCALMMPEVGRIDLTGDVQKREHNIDQFDTVTASPTSRYRLSTQPSLWNRQYMLQYLTDGLTPWIFETIDPMNDGWLVVSVKDYPIVHNEGVRKHDRFKLDLNGMSDEDLEHIKTLITW